MITCRVAEINNMSEKITVNEAKRKLKSIGWKASNFHGQTSREIMKSYRLMFLTSHKNDPGDSDLDDHKRIHKESKIPQIET